MERKQAIVLAMSFIIVGMMFFSLDTPIVLKQKATSENVSSPREAIELADEPVPQEPLRLNVIKNPGFEEWDAVYHKPADWTGVSSAYSYGDPAYTGSIKNGNYAGLVEAEGTNTGTGLGYLRNSVDDSLYSAFLKYGISLSLDWYVISNPDVLNYGVVYLSVHVQNSTGSSQFLIYYFSHGTGLLANSSTVKRIMMNSTIGSWHTFDRNITDDFINSFGSGLLSDTHYIQYIGFYIQSPPAATGMAQAVLDDVSMYNATFSSWIENGDFETGETGPGSPWITYLTSPAYMSQSTDSTSGTYSLNLTSASATTAAGHASLYQSFSTGYGYHALYPRMNILSWDWKYSDASQISQYAYMQVTFYNGSDYYLQFYMGRGNDAIPNNSSTSFNVMAPGFGNRGSWQHSEVDLYPVANEIGYFNMTITDIQFYIYQATPSKIELLVDDFKMMTYPTSDPTFEFVENWGQFDPFTGWAKYTGLGIVTQSTESHGGLYSANITVEDSVEDREEGLIRSNLYTKIDYALFTDFWWRLEDIQGIGGSAYAWIDFEFVVSGVHQHIIYVLGKSSSMPTINGTMKYILVDGFNQTGVWTHLSRNISSDIETLFSTSIDGWSLYSVLIQTSSAAGMRTSLLVDDLYFIDGEAATISSVTIESTPMYYEDTNIRTVASDARPGVSEVIVNYTTDGWSSWDTIIGAYDPSDWYDVYIPAQSYGTAVEFYVIVTDGCGLHAIDDNGGLMYSYSVGDDIDPVLNAPDDVGFTVGATGHVIDWFPSDVQPSTYEVFVESVSTYTGDWNASSEHIIIGLDGLAVGAYNYTCVVYDEAGNSATDTVIVTVNEAVTTSTSPTTTEPTTTPGPTGGDSLGLILVVAGVGGVVVILVLVMILRKKEV